MSLVLWLIMSAATYRICRLMILDKIGSGPRDKFYGLLSRHPNRFTILLQELMRCPYCLSVWVSAGVVGVTWIFFPLVLPVLQWPAVAAGSLVFWHVLDTEG